MTVGTGVHSDIRVDLDEIRRALNLLLEPGQVTELRVLEVSTPDYRRPHTVGGYFDDPRHSSARPRPCR